MQYLRSASPALALLALAPLVTGCPAPPDTVTQLDLSRYAGLWYEIAKYPVFFEIGLTGVTAEYTLRDDGTVRVVNRGFRGSLDGEEQSIEGSATVPDPSEPAKLVVRFNEPIVEFFSADYWVIDLAPDYSWAVVSGPSRQTLWILSRTPQMDPVTYADIVAGLNRRGFNTDRLVPMEQPGA